LETLRKYLSLILVAVYAIAMLSQVVTIGYFYSNQDEIIENYCINKDKPELHCEGQCHLTKQLVVFQGDDLEQNKSFPKAKSFLIFLLAYSNSTQRIISNFDSIQQKESINSKDNYHFNFLSKIFQPPQHYC